MGLSVFFKNTLEEKKIDEFENVKNLGVDSEIPKKDCKSSIPSINFLVSDVSKFPELKNETIEKIKNNPFWGEYSFHSQEKMVSKYFDNKIKRSKYNNIKYNLSDKKNFIEEVLRSVV